MSTDIHMWSCSEAKAHYDPDITDGGVLRLYVFDERGQMVGLLIEGLPKRQAEAIAAACTPCDVAGYPEADTAPADPVITWARPSYHKQARGEPAGPKWCAECHSRVAKPTKTLCEKCAEPASPVMRGEDVLDEYKSRMRVDVPGEALSALNGDDTPPDTAA